MNHLVRLLALLPFALPLAAQTTIVSNTAQTPADGHYYVGPDGGLNQTSAASFTVGSTPFSLAQVTLVFAAQVGSAPQNFQLKLAASSSALENVSDQTVFPATILATFSGPHNPTIAGNYAYTLSGGYSLVSGATYWLVASTGDGIGSNYFRWSMTGSQEQTSSVGATIGNFGRSYSENGGIFVSGNVPLFTVYGNASAIPEPSTCAALAGVAVLALAAWHRRRRAPIAAA